MFTLRSWLVVFLVASMFVHVLYAYYSYLNKGTNNAVPLLPCTDIAYHASFSILTDGGIKVSYPRRDTASQSLCRLFAVGFSQCTGDSILTFSSVIYTFHTIT